MGMMKSWHIACCPFAGVRPLCLCTNQTRSSTIQFCNWCWQFCRLLFLWATMYLALWLDWMQIGRHVWSECPTSINDQSNWSGMLDSQFDHKMGQRCHSCLESSQHWSLSTYANSCGSYPKTSICPGSYLGCKRSYLGCNHSYLGWAGWQWAIEGRPLGRQPMMMGMPQPRSHSPIDNKLRQVRVAITMATFRDLRLFSSRWIQSGKDMYHPR